MIGSSIVSGSLPRARATLSRTSAAAESGSRFSVNRTLMRRRLRAALRRHHLDALDAGERVLERLGHLRLDDLGGRAAIGHRDADDGLVDPRIFAHRQPRVGNEADQQDDQRQHRREDRPLDADLGQLHRGVSAIRTSARGARPRRPCRRGVGGAMTPAAAGLATAGGMRSRRGDCSGRCGAGDVTGAPSRSFSWPAVTTMSSFATPFRISTFAVAALADVDLRAHRLAVDDAVHELLDRPAARAPAPGSTSASCASRVMRRTRANMPGRSAGIRVAHDGRGSRPSARPHRSAD